MDVSRRARDWAIWLTQHGSVTETEGERTLPAALVERIRGNPALAGAESFLIDVPHDPFGRSCAAALLRGEGRDCVLLTGHFDTVTTDDYGDLKHLATDPVPLAQALRDRLAEPRNDAERLALDDLSSGAFLPGRGLLDMKAGLAAALACLEQRAAGSGLRGNVLFVAVPDEEASSAGARALAEALPDIERRYGINVVAAVNLDCIGDRGDGSDGRAIALGSVGKVLLTAFVAGLPSHASHPTDGVNAGALASALAARMEWAPEFVDGPDGIPPTLLSLKDSKLAYDVTTPANVFATWNVLTMGRSAEETLARFRALAVGVADDMARTLSERRAGPVPVAEVIDVATLLEAIEADRAKQSAFRAVALEVRQRRLSIPDQNRALTECLWGLSGRSGPAIVIGFGSVPYPAVALSQAGGAQRLRNALAGALSDPSHARHGPIRLAAHFPGISDMSFLAESPSADMGVIRANTPAWNTAIAWPEHLPGIPMVNIGPWGRDYHTPLERVHEGYAFEVVPGLLASVLSRMFQAERH